MIESLALRLATNLKNRVPDHPASVAVLTYAFNFTLNTFITIFLSIGIALALNQLWAVAVVMFSFAVLRMVSGGYHFKSAIACIIVTVAGANLLPLIPRLSEATIILTSVSLLLVLLLAPSRIEHQSRIPAKYYPLLKVISCGIVASNFLMMSSVIAASFFVQGVSLVVSYIIERRGEINEKA